jgi:hypothetical protein
LKKLSVFALLTRACALQDLELQQVRSVEGVHILECMARFHIVTGHMLSEAPMLEYSDQQNTDQLNKTFMTLHDFYKMLDPVKNREAFSNRAYMDALYILLNLDKVCDEKKMVFFLPIFFNCLLFQPSVSYFVQSLPLVVRQSAPVAFALQAHVALSTNNYVRYFRLARDADIVQVCLLQRYFTLARLQALNTMRGLCYFFSYFFFKKNILLFQRP